MPFHRFLTVAVVLTLAACAPESSSEPSEPFSPPPPGAVRDGLQALAEATGESLDALSQDPCIIGCAGASVAGCQPVKDACDSTLVTQFGGIWMTCTEAIYAGCGGTPGLVICAHSCRARTARDVH